LREVLVRLVRREGRVGRRFHEELKEESCAVGMLLLLLVVEDSWDEEGGNVGAFMV